VNDISENQGLAVLEKPVENANGHAMVATDNLPIAKFVTNEQIIAEEKFLAEKEADVEKRYGGLRGYLRIAHVSP
jgi:hypothetical protein